MLAKVMMIAKRIAALPPVPLLWRHPKVALYHPRRLENSRYMKFGPRTRVGQYSWLSAIPSYAGDTFSPSIEIGENVYIGRFVCITCVDKVTIGDGCVLSEHVYIADAAHGNDPRSNVPIMEQRLIPRGAVTIGKKCFIGFGARILPGVTLGEGCIVGVNAVVTKSFGDYSMVAGIPANIIKRYNFKTDQWEKVDE